MAQRTVESDDEVVTSQPTVYGFPHNCFCVAIFQSLKACRADPTIKTVSHGNRSEVIHLTKGACYQIPVLQDGATVIWESEADSQDIAEYVDAKYGNGRLFPSKTRALQDLILPHLEENCHHAVEMLTDVHFIAGIEDIAEKVMIVRHKERKFGKGCVDKWRAEIPQLYSKLERFVAPFEQLLFPNDFLLGDQPVYLDFMLFGIFTDLTYKNYYPFPEKYKALRSWYQRLAEFRYASVSA